MASRKGVPSTSPFVSRFEIVRERVASWSSYPYSIPAIAKLGTCILHPKVTYFVGENGSGKSTILEGLALALGLNAEGGTQNFRFATRSSESSLGHSLRLARTPSRPNTMFFLRAESYFNVATQVEQLGVRGYGNKSLHEQSHGESFLTLLRERFTEGGLYILDEPEAALSPARQIDALARIHDLVNEGSQFVIATHSPILLSFAEATIYELSTDGIHAVRWDDTEAVRVTRAFFARRR